MGYSWWLKGHGWARRRPPPRSLGGATAAATPLTGQSQLPAGLALVGRLASLCRCRLVRSKRKRGVLLLPPLARPAEPPPPRPLGCRRRKAASGRGGGVEEGQGRPRTASQDSGGRRTTTTHTRRRRRLPALLAWPCRLDGGDRPPNDGPQPGARRLHVQVKGRGARQPPGRAGLRQKLGATGPRWRRSRTGERARHLLGWPRRKQARTGAPTLGATAAPPPPASLACPLGRGVSRPRA